MAARGEVSLTAARAMEPRMCACVYMFGGTIGKCWPEREELDAAAEMFDVQEDERCVMKKCV